MELKIEIKEWKVGKTDNNQKIIGGEYEIKCGNSVVATADFNLGYNATKIPIPAKLMAKIEAIDDEVRQAIVDNFSN